MEIRNKKQAVLYCRVSTKEQAEKGSSLLTQEKFCRHYAIQNGYEVVEVFIEQGESAKTTQRTQWQRLMTYCADRKNSVDAVIAYKIDRISRNLDDYSQIRLQLKKNGVEIKSTSEYFEDTPAGRFMENIISNVSQFDNDVRTERSVNGMKDAMRQGRYVWMAPVGYVNAKIGDKANIVQTETAQFVRRAFTEVAKNLRPIDDIRRQITKEGLHNEQGKPLSKGYFYSLLRNEIYAGWIKKFGERHKGLYTPIISDEEFAQVQRVLKYRKHRTLQYKMENPDFPLRRFIVHPSGDKLTGCWCTGRKKRYAYYRFLKLKRDFRKDDLERAFIELLNSFQLKNEHYSKLRERIEAHIGRANIDQEEDIKKAQKEIFDLKEKQRMLLDKNLQGIISNELLQEQLLLIEKSLLDIYPRTIDERSTIKDPDIAFEQAKQYLLAPGKTWKNAGFSQKLKLQRFHFPKGIVFNGSTFETAEVSSLFNVKRTFYSALSSKVHFRNKSYNTPKTPNTEVFDKLAKEIKDLSGILEEKEGLDSS